MKLLLICIILPGFIFSQSIDTVEYDEVYTFQDNFSLIRKDSKFGILNSRFQEVIPPILESIHMYDIWPYFYNNKLYADLGYNTVIYDTLGNIVHTYPRKVKIDELHPWELKEKSFFLDSIKCRTSNNIYSIKGNKNWGCECNRDTIVPFQYNNIKKGVNGHIVARGNIEDSSYTHIFSNLGVLINSTTSYIKPYPAGNVNWVYMDSGFVVCDSDLVPLNHEIYEKVIVFDSICWLRKNKIWFQVNKTLTPIESYNNISVSKNIYWAYAIKDEKIAIIGPSGFLISKFEYDGDWTDYTSNSTIIMVRNGINISVMNYKGEIIRTIVLNKK